MLEREKIFAWIERELATWPITNARIFGSILDGRNQRPGDVDLLVLYRRNHISEVVRLKNSAVERFFAEFNIELHLLVLSEEEAEEYKTFLDQVLGGSKCALAN